MFRSAAVERMLERAAERINAELQFDAASELRLGRLKLGSSNMRILDAVADATPRVLEDFNPQAIANVRPSRRKTSRRRTSSRLVDGPSVDGPLQRARFGNTAGAAKADKCDSRLFPRIGAVLSDLHVRAPEHFQRCVVLYDGGIPAPNLFRAVADGIVEDGRELHRWRRFNAQAFANLVWAYATVKHDHPQMFDVIEHAAIQCFDQFDPRTRRISPLAYATAERASPHCSVL